MKKRVNHLLIVLFLLAVSSYAVAACTVDGDLDEYGIGCNNGEDCNDNDPFVNPGMSEFCGNGIDDNCDGTIDEGACCADFDKDEYGNPGSEYCTHPETDCDNLDADINPGIKENTFALCIDGIDNDCNGLIDKDDTGSGDSTGCAEFYPTSTGETLTPGGSLLAGQESLCKISSPMWSDADGNIINSASPGQEIVLVVFGELCTGEEVIFRIRKEGTSDMVEEGTGAFEAYAEGEGALYTTTAPTETGGYIFTADTASESATSEVLAVGEAAGRLCEIEWDCSLIDYGTCLAGVKTRDICPGYEGTAQCCADEASCACTPIYPDDACESYAYATAIAEKSCITQESPKAREEEAEEEEETAEEAKFPWMVIGIAAGALAVIGAIVFLITRKPSVQVPASLLNYVKAAREKKVADSAIRQALEKSGWKSEQIKAALKKAK